MLTDDQVKQFQKKGYLVFERLIQGEKLAYDNFSDRTRYSTAWHYIPGDLQMDRFVRGEYEDRHIVRGN